MVKMEIEAVGALAELVGKSRSVTELEWSCGGTTLRICRQAVSVPSVPAHSPDATVVHSRDMAGASDEPDGPSIVKAAVVGVFRAGRNPVQEGTRVGRGDVLGAIETLRSPSDCHSPVDGVVVAVLVGDGDPVEYGQPIFHVRKD